MWKVHSVYENATMQQFLCESQKQKIRVANKEFKDVKKNRNVFVHLRAHINQRDRKVSERVEQPTKIISEYIKWLASLLLTTAWTDAKQWQTMYTFSGSLLLHKHPSFTFVYVFIWEIRQSDSKMKRMETQGHDIYFLDTTKKVV